MSDQALIEYSETEEPRMNPFFAALAASQERGGILTPTHSFHSRMNELQQAAEAGDISEWQERLQEVQEAKEEMGFEGLRELELRVQIKKMEMTLLLQASQNSLFQASMEEQNALLAEQNGEAGEAQAHRNKAQKLQRLGKQLQDQLLSKTA